MNPSKKPLIGDNKTTQRQNGFFTPPRERPLLNSSCHGRETVITGIGVMVQNGKKTCLPSQLLTMGPTTDRMKAWIKKTSHITSVKNGTPP